MNLRILLLGLLPWIAVYSAQAQGQSDHLAVIVNKASAFESITLADLRKIFRAEKTKAPDGSKIMFVMQAPGLPARDAALREIYKMREDEYSKFFLQATFTGTVAALPKALSAAAVKKLVAETPGAIGYVQADGADDKVKVLKVDGSSPGEPNYPLKMK